MEREGHARGGARAMYYPADARRSNGGSNTGFPNRVETCRRKAAAAQAKITIVREREKSFKVSGAAHDPETLLGKAVLPPRSGNQAKRGKSQTENLRDREGSQEHQQVETHVTKASTPNQPKQIQSGILRKS